MANYWLASSPADDPTSPEAYARECIKYHPHLMGANLAFLFKEKASKRDGHPIIVKVSKVSDKNKALQGDEPYDFIVEVGWDAWQEINGANKKAWIDYALAQCWGEEDENTGDMKWKVRSPTITAFPEILGRHGVTWDQGLAHLQVIPGIMTPPEEDYVEVQGSDDVDDATI